MLMAQPQENDSPEKDDIRQMSNLKQAWGMDTDAPLIVVGQLSEIQRAEGSPIYFLEQLEEPSTGRALIYPSARGGQAEESSAFVPRRDALRIIDLAGADTQVRWAIAELELSPKKERLKHKNPDECSVRPGSLRLLMRTAMQKWTTEVA
jgi:hypothetical protein